MPLSSSVATFPETATACSCDGVREKCNLCPFPIGATVKLKSGGPLMTVKVQSGTSVTCLWFDSTNNLKQDNFPAQTIVGPKES